MRKTNILHIVHDLNYGGLQKLLVDLCIHTNRDMFNISVLCLRNLGPLTAQIEALGITVDLLSKKRGTDYFTFLSIARYLKKKRIDIIHTHNSQPLMEGTIASLLSGRHKIIHTDHGRIFPDKKRYMLLEWFSSHYVNKVIAVSDKTAMDLHKYIKIKNSKISVIENGIDGSKFNESPDTNSIRQKLNLHPDDFILGFVGRLVYEKGLKYLLPAISELVQKIPRLKLILVGDGPQRDDLEKQTKNLKLQDTIKFVGLRADTHLFYKIFDLFVLPSVSEGLPLVLLESMAAQCPILTTRVGGIPRVIEHKHSGYLIDSKDSQAIIFAIKYLFQNPPQRKKMAISAYNFFKQNYDVSIMMKKYEQEYEKLLP